MNDKEKKNSSKSTVVELIEERKKVSCLTSGEGIFHFGFWIVLGGILVSRMDFHNEFNSQKITIDTNFPFGCRLKDDWMNIKWKVSINSENLKFFFLFKSK